jgi:hypothetical protein
MECPNCITPWKCNSPHLIRASDFHYSSEDGYYLLENQQWAFIPFEKPLTSKLLIDIATTLHFLNTRNSQ